jgi:glycerate-2-kinase
VPLPLDLDAIRITTQQGTIHIDLGEQVQNMVLMRTSLDIRSTDVIRLILSPMESGRLAVGVIRTPT